ncbi:MAG: hypothetical protein K6F91_09160 [Ruminococcus sp.]|nr:hypothetical protein [Ruminococcus sp.]
MNFYCKLSTLTDTLSYMEKLYNGNIGSHKSSISGIDDNHRFMLRDYIVRVPSLGIILREIQEEKYDEEEQEFLFLDDGIVHVDENDDFEGIMYINFDDYIRSYMNEHNISPDTDPEIIVEVEGKPDLSDYP